MDEVVVTWKNMPGDSEVQYFVNGRPVGKDNDGFNGILDILNTESQIKRVFIRINKMAGFGGLDAQNTLPFNTRYNEFKNAVGKRVLVTRYF